MTVRSRSSSTDILAVIQRKINSLQESVDMLLRRSAPAVDWITISSIGFLNSWQDYGDPGYNVGQYWKDGAGVVHLRGRISSGGVPAVAFQLPQGYRPGGTAGDVFVVNANGSHGVIYIASNGNVTVASGSNVYVDLNSIHFRAEQ